MYVKTIKLHRNGRIAYVLCFCSERDFQYWKDTLEYAAYRLSTSKYKYDQDTAETLYELICKIVKRCDDKYASPQEHTALSSLVFQDEAEYLIESLMLAFDVESNKHLDTLEELNDTLEELSEFMEKYLVFIVIASIYASIFEELSYQPGIDKLLHANLMDACREAERISCRSDASQYDVSQKFLIKEPYCLIPEEVIIAEEYFNEAHGLQLPWLNE